LTSSSELTTKHHLDLPNQTNKINYYRHNIAKISLLRPKCHGPIYHSYISIQSFRLIIGRLRIYNISAEYLYNKKEEDTAAPIKDTHKIAIKLLNIQPAINMYHLLLRLSIFYAFIIVILLSSSICTAYKRPYISAFISNKISVKSHRNSVLCNNSPNNNDNEEDNNDTISTPSSLLLDQILKLETPPEVDPDGTPLFDTNNKRPTLFGLEPNYVDNDDPSSEYAGIDPLDNGLQYTGPIIMMLSIYVTLSLFFGDGMPL